MSESVTARDLVRQLDRMTPQDVEEMNIDVDAIGRAVDPRSLGRDDLTTLLGALSRLADEGAPIDLSAMRPTTFAALITHASRDQLQSVMAEPALRDRVLGEIFRRMGEHLRVERAGTLAAVVHWRMTGGRGDGGYDRYETVIEDGTCSANRDMARPARATITLSPVEFCKLITGNASAPVLFMTGKLKVRGDLAFAASLMTLFDLPRA